MATITAKNYKNATPKDWQTAFHKLYGHIDDRRSIDSIWRHAMVNASRFSSDIRKHNFGYAFNHLAHLMNWLLTTVERCQNSKKLDKNETFFIQKSISEIIWEKYSNKCPYCRTKPCSCSSSGRVDKTKVSLQRKDAAKIKDGPRTLDEWGMMFDELYGNTHAIATIEELSFHLVEETGEVASEIIRITEIINGQDAEKKKEEFLAELADVFSWICSIVNKINHIYFEPAARHFEQRQGASKGVIDVETLSQILWNTYGSPQGLMCPLCKNSPCECDKKLRL